MAIVFRQVSAPPLQCVNAVAPGGAIVGLIGQRGSGKGRLVRLAAGLEKPLAGEVTAGSPVRLLEPGPTLEIPEANTLLIHHALALCDAFEVACAAERLEKLRRRGAAILVVSHDEALLRALCDELWWLNGGRIEARGDPAEVLARYHSCLAGRLRDWGRATGAAPLGPSLRRGDGRARVLSIETLGPDGEPTSVWPGGEPVAVRIRVRFLEPVQDPVIGIMIRTRIGFEVYGTNTELEGVHFGPCQAGEQVQLTYRLDCHLCPQQYTLTAASHDPDGTWHDWLEDAVAFSVADHRYTAGVANLRAKVQVEKA